MLVALVWYRHDFRAHGDPRSLLQAVALRARSTCSSSSSSALVSLFAERDHVAPDLTLRRHARDDLQGPDRARRPLHLRAPGLRRLLRDALLVLGIVGLLILLYLLFRPFVRGRRRRAPSARRGPRSSCARWGDDTLAYFALRERQELLLLRRRPLADRLRLRARLRDGRRRPDRAARGLGARARRVPRLLRRARLAGRLPRRARGRRRRSTASAACTRSTSATRRSSTATRVHPRGRRDEGGARGRQPGRQATTRSS